MKIYTRRGDDGTTALRAGGRVAKDSATIEALGALDEAQSALGVARAGLGEGDVASVLVAVERDLWVLMAEVATDPGHRSRLQPGVTAVTDEMVNQVEAAIDRYMDELGEITDFTVPGENPVAAALDVARTIVRRAERRLVPVDLGRESRVPSYVNRLSDLCWALARASEQEHRFAKKEKR
jgi:cob(I)alamin adenosyltransferase